MESVIELAIKIFIDQGHNPSGFNAGAEGFGLREQDITYAVGTYLADLLRQDGRFEVRVSRPDPDIILGTNTSSSLRARVDAANSWPADYFLSIHVNANENPNVNGTEAYVAREYSEAYFLAGHIVNEIVETVQTKNNGIFIHPTFYVLRNTTMPAVLVELAYVTNYEDSVKLQNEQYQFAYGIYLGLLSYFGLEE